MGLRKYMKKHQSINIGHNEFGHLLIMMILLPIYVVDYNFNTEYYESEEMD